MSTGVAEPRVLNKYTATAFDLARATYIGRGSNWGNPWVIGEDGTREEVLAKYKEWVMSQDYYIELARMELKGQDLVCFCSPQACHGDLLLEIANA